MAAEFKTVKGANGEAQHPLHLALLIWIAKEIEGAGVHSGEVLAVFIGAVWSGEDNDGNLCVLALGKFHDVAIASILEFEATEASRNPIEGEQTLRRVGARCRLDPRPAAINRLREVIAELRVRTDDKQAGRFILITARESAANNGFNAVRNRCHRAHGIPFASGRSWEKKREAGPALLALISQGASTPRPLLPIERNFAFRIGIMPG